MTDTSHINTGHQQQKNEEFKCREVIDSVKLEDADWEIKDFEN